MHFPRILLLVVCLGFVVEELATAAEKNCRAAEGRGSRGVAPEILTVGCKLRIPDEGDPTCFGVCSLPERCNIGAPYTEVEGDATYWWCDICGNPGGGQDCDAYYVETPSFGALVCTSFNCSGGCVPGYHGWSHQWCRCSQT